MTNIANTVADEVVRVEARRISGLIALGLLGLSLALPASQDQVANFSLSYGLKLLSLGWLGFIRWQFVWLANMLTIVGCLLLIVDSKPHRWMAWAIILLPLETFAIALNCGGSGKNCSAANLEAGFYVWLAGCIFVGLYVFNEHRVLKWLLKDSGWNSEH